MILFTASIKHMTYEERLIALREAFGIIGKGLVVVYDTPNRLWYFDGHTAMQPFYHWLPDDVAVGYAKFTEREDFKASFLNTGNESKNDVSVRMARWGRGVSYHDFDIALDKRNSVDVVSSMQEYMGYCIGGCYENYRLMLEEFIPEYLHKGFCECNLFLAMKARI